MIRIEKGGTVYAFYGSSNNVENDDMQVWTSIGEFNKATIHCKNNGDGTYVVSVTGDTGGYREFAISEEYLKYAYGDTFDPAEQKVYINYSADGDDTTTIGRIFAGENTFVGHAQYGAGAYPTQKGELSDISINHTDNQNGFICTAKMLPLDGLTLRNVSRLNGGEQLIGFAQSELSIDRLGAIYSNTSGAAGLMLNTRGTSDGHIYVYKSTTSNIEADAYTSQDFNAYSSFTIHFVRESDGGYTMYFTADTGEGFALKIEKSYFEWAFGENAVTDSNGGYMVYVIHNAYVDSVTTISSIDNKILAGDTSDDGVLSANDLIALRSVLLGAKTAKAAASDCNGDDNMNILDLVRLKKYFADPENTVLGKVEPPQVKSFAVARDNSFVNGYISQPVLETESVTTINPLSSSGRQYWKIGPWNSGSMIDDSDLISYDAAAGTYTYQDDTKLLSRGADGILTLGGVTEGLYPETGFESGRTDWFHLLLEQSFVQNKTKLSDINALNVNISYRLTDFEEWADVNNVNYNAAQAVMYFTVADYEANKSFWFGVPLFDNRYQSVSELVKYDDGTGAYIYSMPQST
ncbi:MAG: dockerin type I repeat-containing protein, partial [Acutalibacteraceae bacterium]